MSDRLWTRSGGSAATRTRSSCPVIDAAPDFLRRGLYDLVKRSTAATSEFGWVLEDTGEGPRYRVLR